jgi:hypothetical protein
VIASFHSLGNAYLRLDQLYGRDHPPQSGLAARTNR